MMNKSLRKLAVLTVIAVMACSVMVLMAGCGGKTSESADSSKVTEESTAPADVGNGGSEKSPEADVLESVVPPEGFDPVGEYQDDTSKRAMMEITPEGEEGHYSVMIHWGSSAFETTIWEFEGDFDREGGLLSYKNGKKIELYLDEDEAQQEKIQYEDGEGALLYFEGGFHWEDKKENAGKDCYFIKTGDLSDTIIEEEEE